MRRLFHYSQNFGKKYSETKILITKIYNTINLCDTTLIKKVLASIASNTFFTIKYWKFAKKVLDPILGNTFFIRVFLPY